VAIQQAFMDMQCARLRLRVHEFERRYRAADFLAARKIRDMLAN
jgi:hypothetical protein